MPTNAKTKSQRAATRQSRRVEPGSAIALLKEDHREVEDYFDEYEDLEDETEKAELAEKICMALKIHTQIEEEIFYPQARKATADKHHVKEEEEELFPEIERSKMDLAKVGQQIAKRKAELMAEAAE
jgi:hemerythrin superfamily protein